MSKTVTTTTTVTLSGDGFGGSPLFTESIQNLSGNAPGSVALSNGFTSISALAPASSLGVVIVPPPGNTVALTLKGVTGDTGIAIDPAHSTRLNWTNVVLPPFGITSVGGVTLELIWE